MLGLLFSLGRNRYAIDCRTVIEVLPGVELTQIPHAPAFVAGQFDYRGSIVPVIDLCQLVDKKPAEQVLSTRIILLAYGGNGDTDLIGLMAEKVTEVRQLDSNAASEPPVATPGAPYLGPLLTGEDGIVQFVNADMLLSREVHEILFVQRG